MHLLQPPKPTDELLAVLPLDGCILGSRRELCHLVGVWVLRLGLGEGLGLELGLGFGFELGLGLGLPAPRQTTSRSPLAPSAPRGGWPPSCWTSS